MKNIDKFWFDDPSILYKKERLIEFFPSPTMHYIEKLNSIVRCGIYAAILIFLYTKNTNIIIIPIIVAAITLYVYKFNKLNVVDKERMGLNVEKLDDCQKPTRDNPFSNVLISDIQDNPRKKRACRITDTNTKNQIENHFNYNLYKDVSDVMDKNNSQRQFVSNPSTTIPNDQTGFANWLYKFGSSCKEDPKACLVYEDIRQKREWTPEPKRKPST